MVIWGILILLVVLVFYIVGVYNGLVTLKVRIKAAIQEIGNQLKRQADLIPNLVEATKGYMKHEKEIFDKLTAARNVAAKALEKNTIDDLVKASEQLSQAFEPVLALFESNPEIKANQTVSKLMDELRDTADKVMYARRLLIDLTADYNTKIQTFPTMLIAKTLGFKKLKGLQTPEQGSFLEVNQKETQTPQVKF